LEFEMSIRFSALLLTLPLMASGAHAAPAPTHDSGDRVPGMTAAAADHVAMPVGCGGCANHDCANCPLHMAVVNGKEGQAAAVGEKSCADD